MTIEDAIHFLMIQVLCYGVDSKKESHGRAWPAYWPAPPDGGGATGRNTSLLGEPDPVDRAAPSGGKGKEEQRCPWSGVFILGVSLVCSSSGCAHRSVRPGDCAEWGGISSLRFHPTPDSSSRAVAGAERGAALAAPAWPHGCALPVLREGRNSPPPRRAPLPLPALLWRLAPVSSAGMPAAGSDHKITKSVFELCFC